MALTGRNGADPVVFAGWTRRSGVRPKASGSSIPYPPSTSGRRRSRTERDPSANAVGFRWRPPHFGHDGRRHAHLGSEGRVGGTRGSSATCPIRRSTCRSAHLPRLCCGLNATD